MAATKIIQWFINKVNTLIILGKRIRIRKSNMKNYQTMKDPGVKFYPISIEKDRHFIAVIR